MSKAKLMSARELIEQKKYDEARKILHGVNHPTARKWLTTIEKMEFRTSQSSLAPVNPTIGVESKKNLEIKILTQKDKWFSSKFDPISIENALNAYGEQGWNVSTGATATFPGFLSTNREELIVFMERYKGSTRMEYKVLTQKDSWFSSKFNPETLEQAINAYAQQGWRVKQAVTATFPGFMSSNREEIIVILERPRQ